MLISCLYNFKACNSDDFEWFYDTVYGNCYKFNSAKQTNRLDEIVTKPGPLNGLRLGKFILI
jgi:hypothetical protein